MEHTLREATAEVEAHWPVCIHTSILHLVSETMATTVNAVGPLHNCGGWIFEGATRLQYCIFNDPRVRRSKWKFGSPCPRLQVYDTILRTEASCNAVTVGL